MGIKILLIDDINVNLINKNILPLPRPIKFMRSFYSAPIINHAKINLSEADKNHTLLVTKIIQVL